LAEKHRGGVIGFFQKFDICLAILTYHIPEKYSLKLHHLGRLSLLTKNGRLHFEIQQPKRGWRKLDRNSASACCPEYTFEVAVEVLLMIIAIWDVI
jgi:hypothetical protein